MIKKLIIALLILTISIIAADAQVISLPIKNANKIFLDNGKSVQNGIGSLDSAVTAVTNAVGNTSGTLETHIANKQAHGIPAYTGNGTKFIRLNTAENTLEFQNIPNPDLTPYALKTETDSIETYLNKIGQSFYQTLYVSDAMTIETALQNGSVLKPFKTIQQALNAIGTTTDLNEFKKSFLIQIVSTGSWNYFTENLEVPFRAITIAGNGVSIQGTINFNVADDDCAACPSSDYRACLTLAGANFSDCRDTHTRLRGGIKVQGMVRSRVRPTAVHQTGKTHDLAFFNTYLVGGLQVDDGTVNTPAPSALACTVYAVNSKFYLTCEGRLMTWNRVQNCEFDNTIIATKFTNVIGTQFLGGLTLTAGNAATDMGWYDTRFATINATTSVGLAFNMDGVTASQWKANVTPTNAPTITYYEHDKGVKNNSTVTGATVYDAINQINVDKASTGSVVLKADKSYVDNNFVTTTAVLLKADKSYVDLNFGTTTAVGLKANSTDVAASDAVNLLKAQTRLSTLDFIGAAIEPALPCDKISGCLVDGNYLYMANGIDATFGGVSIFNIQNKTNPILLSSFSMPTTQTNGVVSMVKKGNMLYIGTAGGYLAPVDVSNPSSPVVYTPVKQTGALAKTYNFQIVGNYAYCASQSIGFGVFDITNATAPVCLYSQGAVGNSVAGVAVKGNYAYVTRYTGGNSIVIWDITNPAAPTVANTVPCGLHPVNIKITGNYAFVADSLSTTNTFKIFDLTNATNPVLISTNNTAGAPGVFGSIHINQYPLVYILTNGTVPDIEAWDCSNVTAPVMIAAYNTGLGANVSGGDISGGYIYTAEYSNRRVGIYSDIFTKLVAKDINASTGTFAKSLSFGGRDVSAEIGLKADKSYVDGIVPSTQSIALKADKSYVDSQDAAITASISIIRNGSGIFNSITGQTITFSTPMPDTTYTIAITPNNDTLYDIGAISFTSKTVNGFTLKNSGENVTTSFDYTATKK